VAVAVAPDAGAGPVVRPRRIDAGVAPAPDAGPAAVVTLQVSPPDSEVKIGDGAWQVLPDGHGTVTVPAGRAFVPVEARNPCCESSSEKIRADQHGGTVSLSLGFLPARITPVCAVADVMVSVDDKPVKLGRPVTISFGDTTQTSRTVAIEFVGKTIDRQEITVKYAEEREVTCKLD
jgi:hypothetical protein